MAERKRRAVTNPQIMTPCGWVELGADRKIGDPIQFWDGSMCAQRCGWIKVIHDDFYIVTTPQGDEVVASRALKTTVDYA